MSYSVTLGHYMGMRIKVHAVFLLLLLVYGFANLLPEAIMVFGVVLFHELGHALAARGYGMTVKEVELLPIGGVARVDQLMSIDPEVEIAVAIAGPINNVLLIAVAFFLRHYLDIPNERFNFFLQSNLMIMAFNLLPALPMDGGRIYRAMLAKKLGFRNATQRAARLGRAAAVVFCVACVLLALVDRFHLILMVTAVFVYQMAGKEQSFALYNLMSHLGNKEQELRRRQCLPVEQLIAYHSTPIKEVIKNFVPNKYHLIWIINSDGSRRQINEGALLSAMMEVGIDAQVGSVD